MTQDSRLHRLDAQRLAIANPYEVEATLFANADVPIDASSITELMEMLELSETVENFARHSPESFATPPRIAQVAVTPDFHKGKGIPIGTVMATQGFIVPQAIGNDVNCGMRLHTTSLSADQIRGNRRKLEVAFRRIFFEGGRNIPMSRVQREALFRGGLTGLLDASPESLTEGIWSLFQASDIERDLSRVSQRGSLKADSTFGLHDFLGPDEGLSRDSQIGSIGGGNHFVELQYVSKILDGPTAYAWGLQQGMVTMMVHTGSVSIGHLCGRHYLERTREIYPKGLTFPNNRIFPLPLGEKHAEDVRQFWDALANAANFAFANRLFLSLMLLQGLQELFGEVESSLVYDAPHNLVWKETRDGEDYFVHRKGACPAHGMEEMSETPFAYYGEPVMVPGSMGASSYLLAGQGNPQSLSSASHGAGRLLSRGQALHGHEEEFARFMENFTVVTPVDLQRPDVKLRRDIVEKKLADIKQEAPFAYKGITPVVETLEHSGIAKPVAELEPLMTIKG